MRQSPYWTANAPLGLDPFTDNNGVLTITAQALTSARYTGTSFGPDGTAGTTFANLQGITVDQSNGDVYAYDAEEGKLYRFDAEGNPVHLEENLNAARKGPLPSDIYEEAKKRVSVS